MSSRRELYVLIAATRWDGPALTERHVAESLSRHGDVLWVEPPLSILGARRRTDLQDARTRPGRVPAAEGIVRVVPPTPPGKDRPGVHRLAGALHAASVRWAVRRDGRRPRAVLSFAARLHPFPAAQLPDVTRVAWIKDDLVAGAGLTGLDSVRVRTGQRALLDTADIVVAASPALVDQLGARGVEALLLPAGADVGRFSRAGDLPVPVDVPTPRGRAAGFVGQLGDRVEVELLEAVADSGVPLLLVGRMAPGTAAGRFGDLLAHPGVTWTGPKPYEELPAYLGAMGVGTVPYVDDAFNRASFPLKLVEYLSAGLQVVSTDLPAARWLETEHVRVANSPAAFAATVRAVLSTRTADTAVAARSVAMVHSWDARVEEFLSLLDRTPTTDR